MKNPNNVPVPSERKNRRLTWKDYAVFASFALALAAVLSFFASAVRMTISSTSGDVITTYGSAYSFIFGGKVTSEHATYTFKGTNGLLLSGWILILVGLIGTASAMACAFLNKLKEEARLKTLYTTDADKLSKSEEAKAKSYFKIDCRNMIKDCPSLSKIL